MKQKIVCRKCTTVLTDLHNWCNPGTGERECIMGQCSKCKAAKVAMVIYERKDFNIPWWRRKILSKKNGE